MLEKIIANRAGHGQDFTFSVGEPTRLAAALRLESMVHPVVIQPLRTGTVRAPGRVPGCGAKLRLFIFSPPA
jgi:hypothetical protein